MRVTMSRPRKQMDKSFRHRYLFDVLYHSTLFITWGVRGVASVSAALSRPHNALCGSLIGGFFDLKWKEGGLASGPHLPLLLLGEAWGPLRSILLDCNMGAHPRVVSVQETGYVQLQQSVSTPVPRWSGRSLI